MLGWCALMFCLGIVAFLDSMFNYGEIFRRINSVLFLLVSLGLLVRTSMKIKLRYIENLQAKLTELETMTGTKAPQTQWEKSNKKQPVA
jgi:hypothetical protein